MAFIYNKNPSARGVLTGLAACMLIHRGTLHIRRASYHDEFSTASILRCLFFIVKVEIEGWVAREACCPLIPFENVTLSS